MHRLQTKSQNFLSNTAKPCIIKPMPHNSNATHVFKTIATFCAIILALHSQSYALDITPPSTTINVSPASPNGNFNWYVTPVGVTLSATDLESGVKTINYRVDTGSWQTVTFADALNLAPNPSMEEIDSNNVPIILDWSASVLDADTNYTRDTANYAPDYPITSAKISSTGIGWHGINNQLHFAATTPLSNMTASVWLKTDTAAGNVYFKVYVVSQDALGQISYTYLTQSPAITATTDWTKVTANFTVNNVQAIGVYLDIGMEGSGTMWADAVTIADTNSSTTAAFTVGSNGQHAIEYYSVDNNSNTELHSCTSPTVNCKTFKIDQTAPSNWHDSGAIRGLFGSDHELYVYTTVEDADSGISTFTDKYQYHIDDFEGFGRYSNLLKCNSTWEPNSSVILISPPFLPGVKSAYLITPKTDFCNNNWKICKTVRFFAEDLAGNKSYKDYCINGPWIKFTGGGAVRANAGINMISEADSDNTDGLIESGNDAISFFSSSKNWKLYNNPAPKAYDYDQWKGKVSPAPTTITGINTNSGVYLINGNYEITNANTPNNYGSATFSQIVFINGDLKISNNISVGNASAALYIVKGKVEIAKSVDTVGIGIFADGQMYTAYNISEGEASSTLALKGIFAVDTVNFQRTLQGTNNQNNPSESFTYEPKYATQLAQYIGVNTVKWISEN